MRAELLFSACAETPSGEVPYNFLFHSCYMEASALPRRKSPPYNYTLYSLYNISGRNLLPHKDEIYYQVFENFLL
nr:MAG TPA: hypothetical protein [Caudoviricetes sp.]